jgi:uncharacterized protein
LSVLTFVALFCTGVTASILGTLVGLGGAFVAIPILRLAFAIPPVEVAGTSLVLVFANNLTGTIGYLRDRRVDVQLGAWLIAGGVPGSIVGAYLTQFFTPAEFDLSYGAVLVALAGLVLYRRTLQARPAGERTFVHRPVFAIPIGLATGLLSSLFGIGGGIVVVPVLLVGARMIPHVVAATSSFVLLCTSPVGIVAHALAHDVDWLFALPLTLGGLLGGWLAPMISRRLSSPRLVTILAVALMVAAAGLIAKHLR